MDPELRSPGPAVSPPQAPRPLVGRVAQAVSALCVVAALAGVAYWGHVTEWTFTRGHAGSATKEQESGEAGVAVVRTGPVVPGGERLPASLRRSVTVEFPSAEAVDRAGIDIAPVWHSAMTDAVSASGELSFDPTRVARLTPRAQGSVWRVLRTAGDTVKAGDVLALVDAAEVGKTKAEFQQALVQLRLKRAALEAIGPDSPVVSAAKRRETEAGVKEAEVRVVAAEQALGNIGLAVKAADYEGVALDKVVGRMRLLAVPDGIEGLSPETASANLLPVRAPFAGVLLSVDAVSGETTEPSKPLFVLVDPSRVWLTLNVPAEDAKRVKLAQTVTFRPDGGTGEASGRVTWVGPAADEQTRTLPVRAELANDDGRLRASTLGRGRVVIREEPKALVVPAEAVQRIDGTAVVFVRDQSYLSPAGPKAFHVRAVTTGATDGQNVEITDGLADDEVVATKGGKLLLGEFARHQNSLAHGR